MWHSYSVLFKSRLAEETGEIKYETKEEANAKAKELQDDPYIEWVCVVWRLEKL